VYRAGLGDKFTELSSNLLVVHEDQSLGEFYGSRLSTQVGDLLSKMGIRPIIPEIYAVTGTSAQNAIMLRGVDLNQYTHLEPFTILSGRSLQPGDAPRLAMIGWRLAAGRKIAVGEMISLRGRDFNVVGIFKNGTYMDNQAWISLADARPCWGGTGCFRLQSFSRKGSCAKMIPLPPWVIVTLKGESLHYSEAQIQPFFDLMCIEVFVMAVSAGLILTNILWRLAWLRRREMAIFTHGRLSHFHDGRLPAGAGRRHHLTWPAAQYLFHAALYHWSEVVHPQLHHRSRLDVTRSACLAWDDHVDDVGRKFGAGLGG